MYVRNLCVQHVFFSAHVSLRALGVHQWLINQFPNKFYQELSHESFKVHMNELVHIGLHECTWGAHILFLPQLLCINHKK